MIPDTCGCGKGKLHEGTTDFTAKIGNDVIVIRNVPAYVCDSCDEAYFPIEISRKIDEAVREFQKRKAIIRSPGAVELKLNA